MAAWFISPFDNARYVDIPYNEQPVSAIPECVRSKVFNRFMDVLPNPETRVHLTEDPRDPTSEYINANYVHGYNGRYPTYIAAMGPLPATIASFWRMVWENRVRVIIMATGLEEGGKVKCERYWPPEFKECMYGDIGVEWLVAEKRNGFLVTKLRVTKDGESFNVMHYWYNTWPDHGVPHRDGRVYPDSIIEMLNVIHEEHDSPNEASAPILIHCSAGIGRTGAIIAIDHCLQLLKTARFVDVCETIEYIRRDRCALVQHPNQYELVYQACLRFAELNRRDIGVADGPPPELAESVQALTVHAAPPTQKRVPALTLEKNEDHISSDEEEEERDVMPELPAGKEEADRKNFLDHVQRPWFFLFYPYGRFHGVMSREVSEDLLRGNPAGTYLVRESPNNPGLYVISLIASDGKMYHNRVAYREGQFRTTRVACPTVHAVLQYYSTPREDFQNALQIRQRTLSIVSSLNDGELKLMALPVNSAQRSQLPPKLAQMELRKAGWLLKQGGGRDQGAFSISGKTGGLFARKNWKRRFFVLQDNMVKYYKEEIHTGAEEALGYIILSADSSVETLKRTYLLYADGVQPAKEWVAILEAAVKKVQGSSV